MAQVLISILFDGLAYGMLLFIIAVGLSITMGLMGFINLAHGAFAMAGGYATVSLTAGFGVPLLLALAFAFLLVGGASILLERGLYAPPVPRLRARPGAAQYRPGVHGRRGVHVLLRTVPAAGGRAGLPEGPDRPRRARLSGLPGVPDRRRPRPDGGALSGFERTLIGARIRAAVDNRRMAQSVGIDVEALFTWTFAFGSGLAAVGGGLAAEVIGLSPTFAIQYLVLFLIVVTVGSAGSLWGAFVAALLLGFLDNAGKYLWPDGGAFFIYIATVALLLRKPDGLFGPAHRF